jgi:hypothetical protein
MDRRSVNDRTAVWQAIDIYEQEYELTEPDPVLEEVRAAYEHWQDANDKLHERFWAWELEEAQNKVVASLDQLLKPSRTSASLRKKRELWTKARERHEALSAAHAEAKAREHTARERYIRLLNQHY